MPKPRRPPQLVQRAAAAANLRQDRLDAFGVERRQLQLRHPGGQAADAIDVAGRLRIVPGKDFVETLGRRRCQDRRRFVAVRQGRGTLFQQQVFPIHAAAGDHAAGRGIELDLRPHGEPDRPEAMLARRPRPGGPGPPIRRDRRPPPGTAAHRGPRWTRPRARRVRRPSVRSGCRARCGGRADRERRSIMPGARLRRSDVLGRSYPAHSVCRRYSAHGA